MPDIHLERLSPAIAKKYGPFIDELTDGQSSNIHSIHIIGSALTQDYNEKASDINSIVVLVDMDLKFVEHIAPLGKKFRKEGISAPLIMTPEYIADSLDVFPIEFLDFQLIHQTVLGEDILGGVEISLADLRHQCERELKSKLIGLRQGYISSLGDMKLLTERFSESISGYLPLFRGIIHLMAKERPVRKRDVITVLGDATGVNTGIFAKVLDIRQGILKPGKKDLDTIFEEYYNATYELGKLVDEHKV